MTHIAAGVAVIGGGPAGLAAATAAARAGADVHLIDAAPDAGGQYWMQPVPGAGHASAQSTAGAAAIAAARTAGVTLHLDAEIWGVFPGHRVCASTPAGPLEIEAPALIVATGAHDRVPPFPGWTLPGVMTAGAAQRLVKLGGVLPGRRVVVAGSGPFLLVVANVLRAAGATIVAFVEAQRPNARLVAHLAAFPGRWGETLALARSLASAPTARRLGWVVTDAFGTEHLEAIRIAPLAARGELVRERSETIGDIDALVTGWGFRPAIEVTSLLRCRHAYDESAGGWYCVADPATGQTSVAGVYAVGEVTGVAGAQVARDAGDLAGRAAAGAPADARVVRRLQRARAFARGLNRAFAPVPAIDELPGSDTIACRCEDVSVAEVRAAQTDGAHSVYGAKLWTRAGMGRCQGRICGWGLARLTAAGGDVAAAGYNQPRIPIRPVRLDIVAAALADDADQIART